MRTTRRNRPDKKDRKPAKFIVKYVPKTHKSKAGILYQKYVKRIVKK